jgi:hypothetical protein
MSAAANADDVIAKIRELRQTERYWPAMACTLEGRAKMQDTKALLDESLRALGKITAETTRTRDALAKVLRKTKPGVFA